MDQAEAMMWVIIPAIIRLAKGFALGWFVSYVILGTVIKIFVVSYKYSYDRQTLFLNFSVSDILFSLTFANPWVLFSVFIALGVRFRLQEISTAIILGILFWILAVLVDMAVIKLISKITRLKRFKMLISVKKLLLVDFFVVAIAMMGGQIVGNIFLEMGR